MVQLPQWLLSLCVLTQIPPVHPSGPVMGPQAVSPGEHPGTQRPALHALPAQQGAPHAPQLLLSERVSTHDPPQNN